MWTPPHRVCAADEREAKQLQHTPSISDALMSSPELVIQTWIPSNMFSTEVRCAVNVNMLAEWRGTTDVMYCSFVRNICCLQSCHMPVSS